MSTNSKPDWLHPGAEVAIYQSVRDLDIPNRAWVQYRTVDRVLKRDVVLDDGTRFRLPHLEKRVDAWSRPIRLLPRDHEDVRLAEQAAQVAKARSAVHRAFDDWKRDPANPATVAALRAAVDALPTR